MAKRKQIINNVVFLLLALMAIRCANQQPPTGGDVDKIPPEIIEVYPPDRTINYAEDFIELTFSEYVDKRSVKDAIFISPAIEGELEFDWSGKSLEINFPSPLKESTTYSITIGTDVKDINNGNNMSEAFSFSFSTGNKIDIGQITGRVYNENPLGILIFAYRTDSTQVDFTKEKPDYISQVGDNGIFRLTGLADGKYIVIAVRDEFRDFLYNLGEDEFGVPFKDVILTSNDSLIRDVNFMITREDTLIPHIFMATMTDANHILIEFNDYVDTSRLSKNNFFVFDSTDLRTIPVVHAFKGKSKNREYYLSISDTLSDGNSNYLVSKEITDLFGNVLVEEYTALTPNENPDTSAPKIYRLGTEEKNNNIDIIKPEIFVELNDGVTIINTKSFVKLFDKDSNAVKISIDIIDDAKFKVIPAQKIKSNSNYFISVDLRSVTDAAGNTGDTTEVKELKTKNELDYSGVFGAVISSHEGNYIAVLKRLPGIGEKPVELKTIPKPDGKFAFPKVTPGKYILWCFEDNNNNGKYDYGKLRPFTLSEKFSFYPDTLNLRARWPVGDVFIEFD